MRHIPTPLARTLGALLLAAAVLTGLFSSTPATAAPSALGSAAPAAKAAPAPFTVGTHNVHDGKGSYPAFAGVIGWQEVYKSKDWKKLNKSLPGYTTYFPGPAPAKADPISFKASRFSLVESGYRRTHKGQKHVTPARYVVWVVLRDAKTGTTFAVVNTHFISGAWSGHPERQKRWKKHAAVLQSVVAGLRQRGLPVLVTGDMNRHKTISLSQTSFVKVKGSSAVPYDQLYASTGIGHARSTKLGKYGSDHNAYKVKVTM